MARGTIYKITKDLYTEEWFDESNYVDKLDILGVDYVKNDEQSQYLLEALETTLAQLGAQVRHDWLKPIAFGFLFADADEVKKKYFEPKLEQLKREAEALTLDSVIEASPALDYICNDNIGDLICVEDDEDLTVDDFIRQLESGITYYVSARTILMH